MLIDRYLASEILRPLVLGVGLFLLIYVGFSLSKNLSMAADGLIDPATALQLVGLSSLTTLEVILPTALFFSVLLVMGRLYQNGEIAALISAGVSPLRLMRSVATAVLLAALLAGLLSIFGRPWAYDNIYRLEAQAISRLDAGELAPGRFVSLDVDGYMFTADERAEQEKLHRGVFLFRTHETAGGGVRKELIRAETARLPRFDPGREAVLDFHNGYSYLLGPEPGSDLSLRFREMSIVWGAAEQARQKYKSKAQPTAALRDSDNPKDIAEYQWRLSTPLATFLLTLLAFPLARSKPRESRLRHNVVALLVYLVLFAEVSLVRTLVEQTTLSPVPGLWIAYLPPALLLLVLVAPERLRRRLLSPRRRPRPAEAA